jgi:hypothetical protein
LLSVFVRFRAPLQSVNVEGLFYSMANQEGDKFHFTQHTASYVVMI